MKPALRLCLLLAVLALPGCLHDKQETSDWFCGYYNSCAQEKSAKCALYGSCD